jgi:TRAP-type C4-dicarboxylate transport system permease large subunit
MGTLPFLVADFVLVALLIFAPSLALWLPRVLY